ncbi:MAG: hypothetical protein UT48_C0029G0014 [Parcubacteria group bacterium GW2011_GWE2_39_37]|uniref:Lipoprotein n=1 Tax=Candidatus Falkowbacteria bacterium GW2011_GWF2_39_8 TaxID=1618642 RepID=A0A0G0Q0S5_9BACT|nr:MAG: hypothetical protein UT48_C0029G0014 [Parcubacteria group bacterium GW2011_GWE2_39_37]KKR33949.1 MAG: hypothetical protein UT64_C0001G0023 [Candidatus Falkowbacteria bacterium GW2011_GWF2_39_8]
MINLIFKTVVLTILALATLTLNGCAVFGNSKQLADENWYGVTTAGGVREIKDIKYQEKVRELAFKKLSAQPVEVKVENGAIQGFKGVIQNFDPRRKINYIISNGPEERAFFVPPGGVVEEYLLEGTYTAKAYFRGRFLGTTTFTVGTQIKDYMGKKVHWYIYYDDY